MPEVELPDGTVVDFPDDTPPDVMKSAIKQHLMTVAGERSVAGAEVGAQARSDRPAPKLSVGNFMRDENLGEPLPGTEGGRPINTQGALTYAAAAGATPLVAPVLPYVPRAIGAATGGYQGYKRGGLPGALAGAVAGGAAPGTIGTAAATAEGYESGGVPGAIVGGATAAVLGSAKGMQGLQGLAGKLTPEIAVSLVRKFGAGGVGKALSGALGSADEIEGTVLSAAKAAPKAVKLAVAQKPIGAIDTVLAESGLAGGQSAGAAGAAASAAKPIVQAADKSAEILETVTKMQAARFGRGEIIKALKNGPMEDATLPEIGTVVDQLRKGKVVMPAYKGGAGRLAQPPQPGTAPDDLEETLRRSIEAYRMP